MSTNMRKQLSKLKRKIILASKQPEEVFQEIFINNSWGDIESISGPGSRLDRTDKILQALPGLLTKFECHTLLDIPCGDFNWMKMLELEIDYTGADIVLELISDNQRKYGNVHRKFIHLDLLKGDLPKVDLIFCRDCLVHFSNHDVKVALQNIRESGSKYLLVTTFPERDKNVSIVTGEWRPVNLTLTPFHLPEPLVFLDDSYESQNYYDKKMGLWEIASFPDR
jgi:hypothetical protein